MNWRQPLVHCQAGTSPAVDASAPQERWAKSSPNRQRRTTWGLRTPRSFRTALQDRIVCMSCCDSNRHSPNVMNPIRIGGVVGNLLRSSLQAGGLLGWRETFFGFVLCSCLKFLQTQFLTRSEVGFHLGIALSQKRFHFLPQLFQLSFV